MTENLRPKTLKLFNLFESIFRSIVKALGSLDPSQGGFLGLDRKLGKFFMPQVKAYLHSKILTIDRKRKITAPFGINIFRCVHREAKGGVEIGGNTIVKILESFDIPHTFNTVESYLSIPLKLNCDLRDSKYSINLYQMTPDQTGFFYHLAGRNFFNDHYNIAYWFWELETIPGRWRSVMNALDEIWTASTFTQKAFQKPDSLPVQVIPPAISTGPVNASRKEFGLPENTFVFLYLFDFRSYFERKNPLAAVRAFKKAFGTSSRVLLLIKCHSSVRYRNYKRLLIQECGQANIRIIEEDMGAAGGVQLISLCDAYLSLHRAEGFGLTIAEAMRLGKPVIATAYSANMDFTTPANSFLVKYDKVLISNNVGPYSKGSSWAEPDINHAAELLVKVYENYSEALQRAEIARSNIHDHYNAERIGGMIKNRLLAIHENMRQPLK